eukprot:5247450-Prymnesium_polylepis.1
MPSSVASRMLPLRNVAPADEEAAAPPAVGRAAGPRSQSPTRAHAAPDGRFPAAEWGPHG